MILDNLGVYETTVTVVNLLKKKSENCVYNVSISYLLFLLKISSFLLY